jgi:hypothetical protein
LKEHTVARRLTASERNEWKERLQVRMSPDEMVRFVDELSEITDAWMLMQPGLEFVRDAWIASRFARICDAKEVRLWPDTRPDFELYRGNGY